MSNNSVLRINKSKLHGSVELAGAKNSALCLLAASLLTSESVTLLNYPAPLLDAQIHVGMLETLGKNTHLINDDEIKITENKRLQSVLLWEGRSIRGTLLILGALTARLGE